MMSVKSWFVLLLIYVAYLILGMYLFNLTECPAELEVKKQTFIRKQKMSDTISQMKHMVEDRPDDQAVLNDILDYLAPGDGGNSRNIDSLYCTRWNLQNSFFFSFTVVTTIGYGHQSPETDQGRIWCLIYAIIGVPLNAILIGALGSVFSSELLRLKKKMWRSFGEKDDELSKPKAFVIFAEGFVFILFFSAIFIFIPAAVFHAIEDDENVPWGYADSVYFAFITLSTIGFGDMVPDRHEKKHIQSNIDKITYLTGVIIWIIFGMGFIFGMVDVISGTMRATSKPVKKAFQGLKNQLHVNDHWRKIINEIIVLKHGEEFDVGEIPECLSILESGGYGWSTPCLGEMEGIDNLALRRSVSTGDMATGDIGKERLSVPELAQTAPLKNDTFEEPSSTLASNLMASLSESQLEELNEDTITSLRQFLTKAQAANFGWAENNISGYKHTVEPESFVKEVMENLSSAPTRVVSRTTSLAEYDRVKVLKTGNHTVTGGGDDSINTLCSQTDFQLMRQRSLQPHMLKRKWSRRSTCSRNSSVGSTGAGGPIGELLENTSLGEFLTAVDNVKKKMIELEPDDDQSSRRQCFIRRISQLSQKRTR